ncbi:MAG TPA: PQQ-binding-like beta-propeller repeat protein [Stellaceae bacterium]|jgi:hypothetical protein
MRRLCARAIGFLLAIAAPSAIALADTSTTVATTLAVQAEAGTPTVAVSADKFKQPVDRMTLGVYLGAIPANAEINSCTLRLVTASEVPKTQYNGVLLQLFDAAQDAKSTKSLAVRPVNADTPAGKVVELSSAGLCQDLKAAKPPASTAQLRLQTTNADAQISFYGRAAEPSKSPRLLLTYVLPNSWPGRADWSQPRRDAQQSGRSPWRIYNPDQRYDPSRFSVRPVGSNSFADVSPPLLLYNRQLVAVSGEANVQFMDANGAVLKTIALDVKPKFIAISPQGWLYATGENRIVMQPIAGQGRAAIDIPEAQTVLNPPTIGADGSLYVVTNTYVYAYPAPPVPVSLANVPLWRYRTGAGNSNGVSTVALSEDGRTAYVVDQQSGAMIALDAATGAEKWKREGLPISRAENDPMPVPVVADRAVFVTNKAPTGSALYIVDGVTGALLGTVSGKDITAPVAGPEQSVYYFRDDALRRLRRDAAGEKFEEVGAGNCPNTASVDLLRADQSGNIYALDRKNNGFLFVAADNSGVPASKCMREAMPGLDSASLIIAADGSVYGYTRKHELQAIVAEENNGLVLSNQFLKLSQDGNVLVENNDMTFRATDVTTDPKLSLPANTNINIVADKSIVFSPGLRIAVGARLHARVGD